MGFWGFVVAARTDGPAGSGGLADVLAGSGLTDVLDVEELPGGWRLVRTGGQGDPAALAGRLAERTGQPALAAFVLDSDCAVLAGATPAGPRWQAAVHPELLADYGPPPGAEILEGDAAVEAALGWARAAGTDPGRPAVAEALGAKEVFAEETTETIMRTLLGA